MDSLKIHKMQVQNFRNLMPTIIDFGPGLNCIIGENGNGKTNILEAVYLLATKKSFRKNTNFPQFLSLDGGKPQIILTSVFKSKKESPLNISSKMKLGQTEWFVDGKGVKRRPLVPIVFINPFDSYNFHNQSSFRRNWVDTYLSQLDKEYKAFLSKAQSSLRFRNSLLSKKPSKFREQIRAIDYELAKYSKLLIDKRLSFLNEIDKYSSKTFTEVFSEEHSLKIVLDSKFSSFSEEQIFNALQVGLKKDEIIGFTKYGVHKDDYLLLFDGLNSFEYCSLGQQKMSYLSLLFAYIELFRYKFDSYPIVLIDDVSGELDKIRWQRLVQYLKTKEFQVLITTANENFKRELEKIEGAKRIKVILGEIKNEIN